MTPNADTGLNGRVGGVFAYQANRLEGFYAQVN